MLATAWPKGIPLNWLAFKNDESGLPRRIFHKSEIEPGNIQTCISPQGSGMSISTNPGVASALTAALLFGIGTPAAKLLLGPVDPWLLAGLLYLGSGLGLALVLVWRRRRRKAHQVHLSHIETAWLAGAILAGGVIAPVLLMWGLFRMPASSAALLLNAEGALTALLAWFVFRESFDRRIAIGMALIVLGTMVLTWSTDASFDSALPAFAVVAACIGWAIDNNLTRKVALADATFIAMIKGLIAGTANIMIAWLLGTALPQPSVLLAAAPLAFFAMASAWCCSSWRYVTSVRRVPVHISRPLHSWARCWPYPCWESPCPFSLGLRPCLWL
jgi:drug/metabolite transporter (DMT)-like permease